MSDMEESPLASDACIAVFRDAAFLWGSKQFPH